MSDSIDAELLDYYQRELTWLRHAGAGFAARYPKVARRLELGPGECGDPHVERLLEGFALLAARLQRRLDDDYAQFSDALLEQLYPLALRPLPSCAVVRFEPDPAKGKLSAGFHLPRGTPLFVSVPGQERIELPEELRGQTLHWRTTDEVTLWPLRIAEVVLLGAEEAQAATGSAGVRGALRLDLRCLDKDGWAALEIDSLRIHLTANPVAKAALFDLLGAHACGLVAEAEGVEPQRLEGLPQRVGFAAEQALLPEDERVHPGLRLLAEYFAFPDKFAFFDLPLEGLRASGEQLYLYVLFDRPAPARLTLQASDLALGCVPAINLFPRTSEPLRPDGTRSEYRLVADAHRENSVEIHSIRSLRASTPLGVVEVAPYHGTQHRPGAFGLYWHARRVEGMTPNRRGSDLLLTLVDAGLQPLEETPQYSLSAELLCTNRGLAEYLPAGTELAFERPGPVARASLLRAPSRQCQPALDGPSRWQLVSQLTLNHLSLVEGPQALDALREILALHDFSEDKLAARQLDGLVRLDCARVVDHVGSDAWRGWRNGLEVRVHLERQAFVGASAVLFGAVLAQFFSLYANANRFVRTVLVQSDQEICRWQPQAGQPITL